MKSVKTNQKQWLAAGVALASVASAATAAMAGNVKICFEGESAASVKSPVRKTLPGPKNKVYSGRGYLDIPWDQNKTKGMGGAVYKIKVTKPGTYYVWARTYWANGCGNSIGVVVNGGKPLTLGEDGTYDSWHWVGGPDVGARVVLKAGVNTIELKNRETGPRVDQFYFCQDPEYVPTGIRKINQ